MASKSMTRKFKKDMKITSIEWISSTEMAMQVKLKDGTKLRGILDVI